MTAPERSYGHEHQHLLGFDAAKSFARAAGGDEQRDGSAASSRHHAARRPPHLRTTTSSSPIYGDEVCDSPASDLNPSMNNHIDGATRPASPALRTSPPAEQIGRLSLDHGHNVEPQASRGRASLSLATTNKRAASSELPRPPGDLPSPDRPHITGPRRNHRLQRVHPAKAQRLGHYDRQPQHCVSSGEDPQQHMGGALRSRLPPSQSHNRYDSGYDSQGSRGHSVPVPQASAHTAAVPSTIDEDSSPESYVSSDNDAFKRDDKYPGLILQPDSSPISQEQLAAEVKGIYAGLVMVEAKCINIDAAQAADPKSQLGPEQWQALIALHRTLLYEHHDFLMATQHPSATPALRGLATKYSMPARMWKHGIHAFLEVLRHRRPESQDYMLSFIYLAYQMMALLFETVPTFTDTWIECLGDLARYRMAIEEEKEAHATWGGVAARWYTMASDRHPAIGRLYHHLGILERPSLRKLCFYAKSLTCVISFPNARDSLSTLCGPIVQDKQTIESSMQSAEARLVTFHALVLNDGNPSTISYVATTALDLLLDTPHKLRDFGAYLAITNTAALFEFGCPDNTLFRHYSTGINLAMQASRPSGNNNPNRYTIPTPAFSDTATVPTTSSASLGTSKDFWVHTLDLVLRSYCSSSVLRDSLAYVHVMLVCVHSLHSLRTRLLHGQSDYTFDSPVDLGELPWGALATYLNTVANSSPISAKLVQYARQGMFLAPERKEDAKPLPEDFLIRGLIWVQFYFRPGWFEGQTEDDGRTIEGQSTLQSRMERVLWLGLFLAFHTGFLQYDVQTRVFSAAPVTSLAPNTKYGTSPVETGYADADCQTEDAEQYSELPNPSERNSLAPSSTSSNSDDSFIHIKPRHVKHESPLHVKREPPPQSPTSATKRDTWTQIAAPNKKRHVADAKVKIAAGRDEMDWSSNDQGIRRGHPLY